MERVGLAVVTAWSGSVTGGGGGLLGVFGQTAADAGADASDRLSLVIAALIGLAVVIAIATFVFWRLTRPDRTPVEPAVRWVPATSEPATEQEDGAAPAGGPGPPDQRG